MVVIYKATCRVTRKAYIGFTTEFVRRKRKHLSDARRGSTAAFHNAIRKYGIDSFVWEILWDGDSIELAKTKLEKKLIAEHSTLCPNGYNMTEVVKGDSNAQLP